MNRGSSVDMVLRKRDEPDRVQPIREAEPHPPERASLGRGSQPRPRAHAFPVDAALLPVLIPPTKVSSISTRPRSFSLLSRTMTRRNLRNHAHAVSHDPNPSKRCNDCALIPFFCESISQAAMNQICSGKRVR